MNRDIVIIGGGLAGIISALLLSRAGFRVTVVEKKSYPFHRVCGEYVSNEVIPFLNSIHSYPSDFKPSEIKKIQLTSISGKSFQTDLDLGGFGISRYRFDHFLYEKARAAGTEFILNTSVDDLTDVENGFILHLSDGRHMECKLVIGAHGKKSRMDIVLDRNFTHHYSPFLAVKYHIEYDFPQDVIALHNFDGGYCGIVRIEEGKYNLCYLASRTLLKRCGSIPNMESEILSRNPFLLDIFKNAKFLFTKPLVINEFSFESKSPVENHVLMAGDAAGLITPLCGNGMAMAIHSGKVVSDIIIKHFKNSQADRQLIENDYEFHWKKIFNRRLWFGRQIQKLFGGKSASEIAVNIMQKSILLNRWIIKNTHGSGF